MAAAQAAGVDGMILRLSGAAEALKAASSAGVQVEIDDDDLSLTASARPPAAVLDLLARHKSDVVVLLRPGGDGWSGEDWLAFFR